MFYKTTKYKNKKRIKYLQLQQKVNNNEINIIGSTENKPLTSDINGNDIGNKEIVKPDNTDNKSESITSNSGLLNRLNKDRSISKSPASIKNEEANSINPSPTPMSGNNLLLYSKGCGTLRSREILKA